MHNAKKLFLTQKTTELMILIISHNTSDISTELVMDWLQHAGYSCKRINGADLLSTVNYALLIDNTSDISLDSGLGFEKKQLLWFRRWMFEGAINIPADIDYDFFASDILSLKKSEFRGLSDAFFQAIRNYNWFELPFFLKKHPVKMAQLQRAKELRINIPNTIITNNKKDLLRFTERISNDLIIKPIKEMQLVGTNENKYFGTYTKILDKGLSDIPDIFFPSLFQESITKFCEIRTFYLKGICYSMAMFSSNDSKTRDDFRKYNLNKPNRYVPYTLPQDLTDKIILFMNSFQFESGSFDFIVNENNEIYFLEINPGGQFGMVSEPCNYFLENKVAQELIKSYNTIN